MDQKKKPVVANSCNPCFIDIAGRFCTDWNDVTTGKGIYKPTTRARKENVSEV
jgi:hypothetical protein